MLLWQPLRVHVRCRSSAWLSTTPLENGALCAWYDQQVRRGKLLREPAHAQAIVELDRLLGELDGYVQSKPPPLMNYPCPNALARLARDSKQPIATRLRDSLKYWFTTSRKPNTRSSAPKLHDFDAEPNLDDPPSDPRPPLLSRWSGQARTGFLNMGRRAPIRVVDPFQTGVHVFGPPSPAPKSVGLTGAVGSGKSLLMDAFFELAPVPMERKRRVHFHDFLAEFHGVWMGRWRASQTHWSSDPIAGVARAMAAETTLLCFDEVHITDKVNAVILSKLLPDLWYHGVVLVATSNKRVDHHWETNNQQERQTILQPLVKAWHWHVANISIDCSRDYRRQHPLNTASYVVLPESSSAHASVNQSIVDELCAANTTGTSAQQLVECTVTCSPTRSVQLKALGDVGFADFKQLCSQPLGAEEYAAIARRFTTLCLMNVPAFRYDIVSEARRFIILIDQLYEQRVQLVVSAAVSPDQLFSFSEGGQVSASADILEEAFDDRTVATGAFDLNSADPLMGISDTAFMYHRAVSRLFELTSASATMMTMRDRTAQLHR